jgi:hypothetical protein
MELYQDSLIRRIAVNTWLTISERNKLFELAENTPEEKRTALLESLAKDSDRSDLVTRKILQNKIRDM